MFGPDHLRKVEIARASLREMLKLDPLVMTHALTMVGCEGMIDMVDRREEIAKQMTDKFGGFP